MKKKSLLIALLVISTVQVSPIFAQPSKKQDPFSTPNRTPQVQKPKEEKVVVHIPTLELVTEWLDMNLGIANSIDEAVKLSQTIESMREQPNPEMAKIQKLEQQLAKRRAANRKADEKLARIPRDTTFDLVRWEQFREELKFRRQQFRAMKWEKEYEIDALRKENESLRAEIEQLKNAGQ